MKIGRIRAKGTHIMQSGLQGALGSNRSMSSKAAPPDGKLSSDSQGREIRTPLARIAVHRTASSAHEAVSDSLSRLTDLRETFAAEGVYTVPWKYTFTHCCVVVTTTTASCVFEGVTLVA